MGLFSFLRGLLPTGEGGDETLPDAVQRESEAEFEREVGEQARAEDGPEPPTEGN